MPRGDHPELGTAFLPGGWFRYDGLDSSPSRSMLLTAAFVVIATLVLLVASDSEDPRAGD